MKHSGSWISCKFWHGFWIKLCLSVLMFVSWVLKEIWIIDLSSASVGRLTSSSKLFLFSNEAHLNSDVKLSLELYCLITFKHVAFFTIWQNWHEYIKISSTNWILLSAFVSLEGEHDHVILQKFFYLLGNLSLVALALYKCHSMGLLPTATSDWLAFMEHKTVSHQPLTLFLPETHLRFYSTPDNLLVKGRPLGQ